ncbi:MAG TPA: DUF1203 domain-containing protein [bacterium]|nr:DUF1203 domain-containing protein [bacterium]
MDQYKYIAIPSRTAEQVRATMRAPGYGHPAHREVATGFGPCRHCLRSFVEGADERILFTFDPFHGLEPLPLPGPVFIHAEPCARYDERAGFPAQLRAHPMTLNGYAAGRRLLAQVYVNDGRVETALDEIFAEQQVAYVHIRNSEVGCYQLRVERRDRENQ